jgi:hypothetical protein
LNVENREKNETSLGKCKIHRKFPSTKRDHVDKLEQKQPSDVENLILKKLEELNFRNQKVMVQKIVVHVNESRTGEKELFK